MSKIQYPSTVYIVYHAPDGNDEPYYLAFANKGEAIDDAIGNVVNVGVYRLSSLNRPIIDRKFAED